jgi:predicted DNA-binding antitoxin AbrB/MazE fold protein
MVRHVDAIFTQGAFRPLEPLKLPEGSRVRLSVEDASSARLIPQVAKLHTPKLARPEDIADFIMEVREAGDSLQQDDFAQLLKEIRIA